GYYQSMDKSRASDTSGISNRYDRTDAGNRLQRVRYRLGWANESWNVTTFFNYFGHGENNLNGVNLIPPCFYLTGVTPGSCYPGGPTSAYFGPTQVYHNQTPATVYVDLSVGYNTG